MAFYFLIVNSEESFLSFKQSGRMERIIAALDPEEEEMFRNMMRRLHYIARVSTSLPHL